MDNSLCIYILPVQFLPSLLNPGKHMQRKEPNRFKQAPLTPQGEDVEHSLTSWWSKTSWFRKHEYDTYLSLLYSWNFFPSALLLRGHMTSNNENVSRQNLWAGNIAKSMTSKGNSALLPSNVDRRPPWRRGLMNFQLQNFQLYSKSLKDWSFGKQLILFSSEPVIKF